MHPSSHRPCPPSLPSTVAFPSERGRKGRRIRSAPVRLISTNLQPLFPACRRAPTREKQRFPGSPTFPNSRKRLFPGSRRPTASRKRLFFGFRRSTTSRKRCFLVPDVRQQARNTVSWFPTSDSKPETLFLGSRRSTASRKRLFFGSRRPTASRKHCFLVHDVRQQAGNTVSWFPTFNNKPETLFLGSRRSTTSRKRLFLGSRRPTASRKRLFFGSRRSTARKNQTTRTGTSLPQTSQHDKINTFPNETTEGRPQTGSRKKKT